MPELRETDARLKEMASRLRLTYTRDHLTALLDTAVAGSMTQRETIDFLFRNEIEQRDGNRIRLARMGAHFPFAATLEAFDTSFQTSIDPGILRELSSLEWIYAAENVLFIGPSGVGKTHLSIALAQKALERGISVRFYHAMKLVQHLEKAHRMGTHEQLIKEVNKYRLIILDEIGFLPMTILQGQLFFELISSRYDKKSVIVTSNKTPGEWGSLFGDAAAASAALDRLMHHCTPVVLSGESYRTKECKLRQAIRQHKQIA